MASQQNISKPAAWFMVALAFALATPRQLVHVLLGHDHGAIYGQTLMLDTASASDCSFDDFSKPESGVPATIVQHVRNFIVGSGFFAPLTSSLLPDFHSPESPRAPPVTC